MGIDSCPTGSGGDVITPDAVEDLERDGDILEDERSWPKDKQTI